MKDTVDDLQSVVSSGERRHHVVVVLIDDSVKFAESRQGGCSHPDDEILIDEACVVRVAAELVHRLAPVHRLRRT